jgi:hypothetical protein
MIEKSSVFFSKKRKKTQHFGRDQEKRKLFTKDEPR